MGLVGFLRKKLNNHSIRELLQELRWVLRYSLQCRLGRRACWR